MAEYVVSWMLKPTGTFEQPNRRFYEVFNTKDSIKNRADATAKYDAVRTDKNLVSAIFSKIIESHANLINK